MASFPVVNIESDNIFMRWGAEDVTYSINKKLLSSPKGVYRGFIPSASSSDPANILRLSTENGLSIIRVKSLTTNVVVDIFLTESLELDFTGHDFTDPVYVIASADYSTSRPTTGKIFTRATGGDGVTEINICKLTKSINLNPSYTSVPSERHTSEAHAEQDYGFLINNSVSNLETAMTTVSEVTDAREDYNSSLVHSSLSERLLKDFSTVSERLSRSVDILLSNKYRILSSYATRNSLNVSSSFFSITRESKPYINIFTSGTPGKGSTNLAITSSPDNIIIPFNTNTNKRFVDSGNRLVYGRLNNSTVFNLSGITSTFTNAQSIVTGNSNYTTSALQVGDSIKGPDGNYYEVEGPISTSSFVISPAYAGTTDSELNSEVTRYTINFYTLDSGLGEQSYSFPAGDIDLEFYFPCFVTTSSERYDRKHDLILNNNIEFNTASESATGVAILAADNSNTALTVVQTNDSRLQNICKTDGSTDFTAVQKYSSPASSISISSDNDLTHKYYVDNTTPITKKHFIAPVASPAFGVQSFVYDFSAQGFNIVTHAYPTIYQWQEVGVWDAGETVDITDIAISSSTVVTVDFNNATNSHNFRVGIIAFGR